MDVTLIISLPNVSVCVRYFAPESRRHATH
jgi:hypothetical protein